MVRYYHFLDGYGKKQKAITFSSLWFCLCVLFCVMTFSAYRIYIKEGNKSKTNTVIYQQNVNDSSSLELVRDKFTPLFDLLVTVDDVDPLKGELKLHTRLTLRNLTANVNNVYVLFGKLPMELFKPRTLLLDKQISLPIDGDPNRYPFDKYNLEIPFAITRGNIAENDTIELIEYTMVSYGALQNWRFEMAVSQRSNYPITFLEMNIKRSPTTIGFSMFIVSVMWLFSLAAIAMTFVILVRRREVPPPVISVLITLLFALPTVRNTQPNIPPIGTLCDVVGLFFNMAIVSLAAVCAMVMWILGGPSPRPKQQDTFSNNNNSKKKKKKFLLKSRSPPACCV